MRKGKGSSWLALVGGQVRLSSLIDEVWSVDCL